MKIRMLKERKRGLESGKRRNIDFTEGSVYKELIAFSLPLLTGNLLLQLYFIADAVIVGRLIGSQALASVGTVTTITGLVIFFFQGIASGGGILISQAVGAQEIGRIRNFVIGGVFFTVIFGIIISLVSYFLAPYVLKLINVPEDIFSQALLYLRIFLGGILPLLIFNMGGAFLQAMGNSKTPLYYLGLASFVNIGLDIFFVTQMGIGVEGTAIATVIAMIISALLIMISVNKSIKAYDCSAEKDEKEEIEENYIHIIEKIWRLGFPIGVQSTVIGLSNVVVQNHINLLGSATIAAWAAFCRIDTFVIMPFMSVGLAIMTFVGQNFGAGKGARIAEGEKAAKIITFTVTISISLILIMIPGFFYGFFTRDSQVVELAVSMTRLMVPFYFLIALTKVYTSIVSGMGDSKTPLYVNLAFMCVYRVILIPILSKVFGNSMSIIYATYYSSWILSYIAIKIYYMIKGKRILNTITEGEK